LPVALGGTRKHATALTELRAIERRKQAAAKRKTVFKKGKNSEEEGTKKKEWRSAQDLADDN